MGANQLYNNGEIIAGCSFCTDLVVNYHCALFVHHSRQILEDSVDVDDVRLKKKPFGHNY